MEQEDFRNIRVGRTSECRKMSEDCSETSECGIGKCQSMENIGNIGNVRVWNRKTSETSETLECEIGMEI